MNSPQGLPTPVIPISWGELIDRITILEIKSERLKDATALANTSHELFRLRRIAGALPEEIDALVARLKNINQTLWEVEDAIRGKEAAGQFDDEFVQLARAVYTNNDARGALKRQISLLLKSELLEEKNYTSY